MVIKPYFFPVEVSRGIKKIGFGIDTFLDYKESNVFTHFILIITV